MPSLAAKILIDTIKKIYKLRTCNLNLSPDKIDDGKYKVCLEYHIKNCLGPCEGLESEEEYNDKIKAIRGILKGDYKIARQYLTGQMMHFAEKWNSKCPDGKRATGNSGGLPDT